MLPHMPFGKRIRLEMLIAIPGFHSIAQVVGREESPKPLSESRFSGQDGI
jgi:hypothetical protein